MTAMTDQLAIETPPTKMTTADLKTALRRSFGQDTDAAERRRGDSTEAELLIEEVAAPGTNRRCDLLRLGIWPSRGHHIVVHELKVSRSDWLRELDDPEKAEAWWKYCHEFWIVAPDGVVEVGELPEGWGLMVPPANRRHRRFQVRQPATVKVPHLSVELLVEIVRRADNARLTQIADLNRRRDQLVAEEVRRTRKEERTTAAKAAVSPEVADRLEVLDKLETALGMPIDRWGWGVAGDIRTLGVEEMTAALREYTSDHVAVQRREKELRGRAARFERAANQALITARELAGGEAGG